MTQANRDQNRVTSLLAIDDTNSDNTVALTADPITKALNVAAELDKTGLATDTKQDTIIGHIDGIEGLLTTIDSDTSTLAGVVSGSEMQVDVVGALPAGTNNIGTVAPYAQPGSFLSGTASATGTSDTSVISAQGSGIRIYVTSIIISNSSATDTEVVIKSATTALTTFPAPANGGAVHAFPVPLRLTANTALNFASLASVTTMKVSAVGYSSSV